MNQPISKMLDFVLPGESPVFAQRLRRTLKSHVAGLTQDPNKQIHSLVSAPTRPLRLGCSDAQDCPYNCRRFRPSKIYRFCTSEIPGLYYPKCKAQQRLSSLNQAFKKQEGAFQIRWFDKGYLTVDENHASGGNLGSAWDTKFAITPPGEAS